MTTSLLYLDCIGGIAGDMLLSALVDAGASVRSVRNALPIEGLDVRVDRVTRHGVGALKLTVVTPEDHTHRRWRDVRQLIDAAHMRPRARTRAHAAFELLAKAEGRVHGVSPEEVLFHEVGALDAIADICGVAVALEDLGIDEVACSALPLGHGTTIGAHGVLPLPAPATLDLLRGAAVHGVDVAGETVTPTGAALVAALTSDYGPSPQMTLRTIGCGAGTADFAHAPNVVRALIGQPLEQDALEAGPLILETNLDDLAPEFVPDVIERCLAAGAADAWTTPIFMKYGRPAITLSALVHPAVEREVAETILRNSTALGVRVRRSEHRWALDREFRTVEVAGHSVNVKFGRLRGEIVNVKPEHRDCVRVAEQTGRTVKAIWTSALTQAHRHL